MITRSQVNEPIAASNGRLTAISDGLIVATYDKNSLAVGSIDTDTEINSNELLRAILSKVADETELTQKPQVASSLVSSSFAPLLDKTKCGCSHLHRLTLNISNACNLWCSYCYADHGTYHSPASLMAVEQAVQAVARCLDMYASIRTVQFFGGEPLLNPQAIEAVCDFLTNKLGSSCPRFVATTNGTILNEHIENLLQKYNIGLTISLDGPALIHDRLRPTRSNASSHSAIMHNVERLRDLGIELDFECTYTLAHYQAGISVCDLLDYFDQEVREREPHISWSYLPEEDLVQNPEQKEIGIFRKDIEIQARQHLPVSLVQVLFRSAARKSMENIAARRGAALTFVLGILKRLAIRQKASAYCPAFTSQLSIASDGSVYPCFMFIGDSRMKMGNIFSAEFPDGKVAATWQRYINEFGSSATGTNAWYSDLVSGCIAGDYISTGGLNRRLYEPVQEAMIQEVILGLARSLRE